MLCHVAIILAKLVIIPRISAKRAFFLIKNMYLVGNAYLCVLKMTIEWSITIRLLHTIL